MTTKPPPALTRVIGTVERGLRELLDRELKHVGLTFPEWVVLTFLDQEAAMSEEELVERQVTGHVAPRDAASSTVQHLHTTGMIKTVEDGLTLADQGRGVYRPAQRAVAALTARLHADLPAEDLQATVRTLLTMTDRIHALRAECP